MGYEKTAGMNVFQETSDFTQNLCSRLKDIDAVADEMVSKVENMKKEMISRKEVQRHPVAKIKFDLDGRAYRQFQWSESSQNSHSGQT